MPIDDWIVKSNGYGCYELSAGCMLVPAIIGRGGLVLPPDKKEGDGATPCGRWPLKAVFYRKDRVACPSTVIPCYEITADCGWCDDEGSVYYNRYVKRPFKFRHEKMWRDDTAYDLLVALGYNDSPVINGRGSAIFLHCIDFGKKNTAGCVAVDCKDLANLIERASANQHIEIIYSLPNV